VPIPGNLLELHAVCARCRNGGFRFHEARSWGLYEGDLRRVIQAFKFEGQSRLAAPLSDFLRECQSGNFPEADWIIPVPLHPRKRRERGFDQTSLLAESLSKKAGIPLAPCIRRIRYTQPQFGLDHLSRRRNIRGAFELNQRWTLDNKRVLLVDDVMTTGATVEEICRVLQLEARTKEILVLTVARVAKLI
jgi:ComF family protein